MKQLTLYVMPGCPFCERVTDYIDQENLDVDIVDIFEDRAGLRHLRKVGGKIQCPCLFIDDEPLYESVAIMDYLKQNQ